jgi:hypothetical protein
VDRSKNGGKYARAFFKIGDVIEAAGLERHSRVLFGLRAINRPRKF